MIKKIFLKISSHKILVLILTVAACLRFIGTNPGHNPFHPDEGISYSAATSMMINNNLDPLRYDYPALVPLVNYVFFEGFFSPISWVGYYKDILPKIIAGTINFPPSHKEQIKIFRKNILGYREINALFWGRYITALISLLSIILVYLLASKLFSKEVGLIAAFLLAFNFKTVQNSHIGLPDIYNAFFLLLSLLLTTRLMKSDRLRDYVLAGVGVGLYFATKYQINAFFPLGFIYFLKTWEKGKINFLKLLNWKIFVSLAISGLVFFLTNLYFFIHWNKAIRAVTDVSLKYAFGRNELNLYPFYYFLNIDYGVIELLAITLGIIWAVVKYRKNSLILLWVVVPFFYTFLYYSNGGFYVRNFITITPILLTFAAVFIWESFQWFSKKITPTSAKLLLMVFLVFAIFLPAKNAIANSYFYTRPWNYDVFRSWANKNLTKGTVIASHPFDPLPDFVKRTEFEIDGNYSLAEHKEASASLALMNLDWAGNPFYFWMNFGMEHLDYIFNKPMDMMRNTFHGIAAEELFRYQIYSITKPRQAPDAGLILAKLSDWPPTPTQIIQSFSFDKDLTGWNSFGKNSKTSADFNFDSSEGKSNKGSIKFRTGSSNQILRITSQPIEIKPKHLYRIKAFLKSEKNLGPRQRDGFLRVDFYPERFDLSKVGLVSSVSSRIYGTTDWLEKEIKERAPEETKFLTVSFQVNGGLSSNFWLDDLTIDESKDEVVDITEKSPYKKSQIELDLLYPHSHGNL